MKIILRKNVDNLGQVGDVVNVKMVMHVIILFLTDLLILQEKVH